MKNLQTRIKENPVTARALERFSRHIHTDDPEARENTALEYTARHIQANYNGDINAFAHGLSKNNAFEYLIHSYGKSMLGF